EVALDVDAEPGPRLLLVLRRHVRRALGKIADVTDARRDVEVGAEVAGDRLRLGRRLDDHEAALVSGLGHSHEGSATRYSVQWRGPPLCIRHWPSRVNP